MAGGREEGVRAVVPGSTELVGGEEEAYGSAGLKEVLRHH